jgi:hypothetical protein
MFVVGGSGLLFLGGRGSGFHRDIYRDSDKGCKGDVKKGGGIAW